MFFGSYSGLLQRAVVAKDPMSSKSWPKLSAGMRNTKFLASSHFLLATASERRGNNAQRLATSIHEERRPMWNSLSSLRTLKIDDFI